MRIIDWSSDVCSSDLLPHRSFARPMAGGEVLDINLLPRHEMARKVVLLESFVHALVERRIHRRHHKPVTAGTATADQAGVSACVRWSRFRCAMNSKHKIVREKGRGRLCKAVCISVVAHT